MLVLKIIGALLLLAAAYALLAHLNNESNQRFKYKPFSWDNFLLMAVSTAPSMGAFFWYRVTHGTVETLNLYVLAALSVAGVVYLVYRNIKHTNQEYGLAISLVQVPVLLVLGVLGVLVFLALIAWASQTKPVYTINGGNN